MSDSDWQVVYETDTAYCMQTGPHGYDRVGVRFGSRVVWLGCTGSGLPQTPYEEAKALAEQIVAAGRTLAAFGPVNENGDA